MKRIIALILVSLMIVSIYIPVSAAGSVLSISFKSGSNVISVNGASRTIEKPFFKNNALFVPLESILVSYGAEVVFKEKNKVRIVYRDNDISFTIGSKSYVSSEITKQFSVLPETVNKVLMVPVDFITSNFGGKLSYNKVNSTYTLTLSDDGAITDFSAVIGSISKNKVGNSYFGWSINIPKGSQLVNNSFNSKDVVISSEQRGISIQVNVDMDEGKKFQDYLNEMKNPDSDSRKDSLTAGKIIDSTINTANNPGYLEVLTSNYQSGGIIRRIYINNGYVYKLTFSSQKEVNPNKLKNDKYIMSLVNSFKFGYKGKTQDIKDLSKVKDGMVKYIDTYLGFSFNVPAEWEILDSSYSSDIPEYKIGLSNKEYIEVYPEFAEAITDISKYGDYIKNKYDSIYNSKFYKFIDKKDTELVGKKAVNLTFNLTIKGATSIFDENMVNLNGIYYTFSIKSPENLYNKKTELYKKILSSITSSNKNSDNIKKFMESDKTEATMSRVGKDDSIVDYKDKNNHFEIKIPGFYETVQYFEDSIKIFSNPLNNAYIGIETVENDSDTLKQDDRNVFETLKSIKDGKDNYNFISKEEAKVRDKSITVYKYRLEDDKNDTYADAIHYIIHGEKYSYCFFYVLEDIYSSEKNLKEIDDVWNSFTMVEK